MIRRLRIRFVCITMALLTAMLLVIFGLVCYFTASGLEREAVAAMKAAAVSQFRPGRPGNPVSEHTRPCFSIEKDQQGKLRLQGGDYFDLSDQQMVESIYQAALADGHQLGKLETYGLRYFREETPVGTKLVFTGTAADRQTMSGLVRRCVMIGVIAMLCFLGISVGLAFWSVGPVEKAWKQQRQFVADASHELKTPLTVILTNAELLRSPEYGQEQRQQFTDSILTMSCQMRRLVESLLELARADRLEEQREYTALDFSLLVEDAVLPFEPVYFESGRFLDSSIDSGICVKGDSRYLRQVVEVLLDNGVKYSESGSTTVLKLMKQHRGKVLLTVFTPGTPLTKEQCGEIFKRFSRVDEARSRNGSYGLGLSIAHRIVESHGGRIWAQAAEGGNLFSVSLPEL